MHLLPLILLIVTLPLGVAVQNIAAGLAVLIICINIIRRKNYKVDFEKVINGKLSPVIPTILAFAYILWLCVSTVLNVDHPTGSYGKFIGGYTYWAILPLILAANYQDFTGKDWQTIYRIGSIVCLIWGLVALSQLVWGWKVSGASFVDGPTRAQGFYSHPLTLAYSAILIFPLAAYRFASSRRDKNSWALFTGAILLVLASQSRAVQIVCMFILTYNFFKYGKKNLKIVFVIASFVSITFISVTDNRLKRRFAGIFDPNYDKSSGYADDRLVFWKVHSNMFLERPIVGHGQNLTTEYRTPWYDSAGFEAISKKYEAHNVFLQVAVCGGIVGLALFLSWWGYYFINIWRIVYDPYAGMILITMASFCIASFTQNSFQDSEVRNTLTLFTGLTCLFLRKPKQNCLD